MSAQLTETLDLTGPDDDEVIGDKEHAQLEIIEAELTQVRCIGVIGAMPGRIVRSAYACLQLAGIRSR